MEAVSGVRAVLSMVAAALAAFSIVNVATTFLPGPPVFGMGPTMVLFVLVLPLFAGAILWLTFGGRRGDASPSRREINEDLARQWGMLPRRLRRGLGVLVIALWACGLSGVLLGPSGAPHHEDGRYYLNDHGTETDITEDEYDEALQLSVRSFASVDATLLLVAAAMLRWFRPLRGAESPEPG
jgi:hypothetical protein